MLAEARIATRLPAQDLRRARAFYAEKLGLEPAEERGGPARDRPAAGGFRGRLTSTRRGLRGGAGCSGTRPPGRSRCDRGNTVRPTARSCVRQRSGPRGGATFRNDEVLREGTQAQAL